MLFRTTLFFTVYSLLLSAFATGQEPVPETPDAPSPPSWARFGDAEQQKNVRKESYDSTLLGIRWLAAAQAKDGSWPVGPNSNEPSYECTALSVLAFLGEGHSTRFGEHQEVVRKAADWLIEHSKATSDVRVLALTTLAFAELRLIDGGSTDTRCEQLIAALEGSRTPDGVWPATKGGVADLLSTTWASRALICAAEAPSSKVDLRTLDVLAWIASKTEKTGRLRIEGDGIAKERGAALALNCRLMLGAKQAEVPYMQWQINRLAKKNASPNWKQQDLEYWLATTHAFQQLGDKERQAWFPKMVEVLLEQQDKTQGQWSAVGVGGSKGQVRSTAMAILTLASPYRSRQLPEHSKGADGPASLLTINPSTPSPGKPRFGGSFSGSFGGRRNLRKSGGAGTEEPLLRAIDWLVRGQAEDGSWSSKETQHPVGTTALALLALIGDGHTTLAGKYKGNVRRGIKWLRQAQDAQSGRLGTGPPHTAAYDHAIGTLALAEAYYFSRSPLLKASLERAVNYILAARDPKGTWNYKVPAQGPGDVSVTSWMFFALKSAAECGIEIDNRVWEGVSQQLDAFTDSASGRVGYRDRGGPSSRMHRNSTTHPAREVEAMTAAGLLCRVFLGQSQGSPQLQQHADLLLKKLPQWQANGSSCDLYYWYYGSYGMYQMGGKYWKAWNIAMKKAVLESQVTLGPNKGSWDPVGPWGDAGGRVYATAMMALTLEVYFRYARQI